MSGIIFDAGPIISLTINNLNWILEPLKNKYDGEFFITKGVREELVDRPFQTHRFKFEAIQVERLIEKGILSVIDDVGVEEEANKLMNNANKALFAHFNPIQIVQRGEMETLAAAALYGADAVVIDERITRTLIENPDGLRKLMEKRLHTKIYANQNQLSNFSKTLQNIPILRSSELIARAFELGFLEEYIVKIPNAKRELIESILWGLKMNGCAISEEEITELVKKLT